MKMSSFFALEIQQGATDALKLVMTVVDDLYQIYTQMRIYLKWERLGKYRQKNTKINKCCF